LFGRRGRKDPLEEINLLELAPVRLADWFQDEEGGVTLVRPRPRSKGLKRLSDLLGYYSSPKRVRLDAVGSLAWKHLDGRPTVAEIARKVRDEFEEEAEPAEERVGLFVRLLRGEGMVAYPGWDDLPEREAVEVEPAAVEARNE